jgi:putative spermidine/putrescine transport system permease protein
MTGIEPSGSRASRLCLGIVCTLVGFWLILPLGLIIPISFSGEDSFSFPPRSWTLERYASLTDPMWGRAFMNSLVIGLLVALVSALLGTFAAFAIARSRSRVVSILRVLILAPQIVPIIIVGFGVYLVFLRWDLTGTILGFVLAHSALGLPFVAIPVVAALQTFDRNRERASASLGAGPFATFLQVTFPIIRPAIFSGALLAFLASFDELVLALFLQSPSFLTLPVLLYRRMRDVIDPTIAAVATIQLVCVISCVLVALVVGSRRQSREASKAQV